MVFRSVAKLNDWARDADERPFFLLTSLTHPHDPYICTQPYWDRYSDVEIELPRVRLADDEQDPHSRRVRAIYGVDQLELSDDDWRQLRRGYYGNVSYIDDKIGELLSALERGGFAENTVVIFTSDHGEMLGERGLIQKKTFFEDSVRVPLLIKTPDGGVAGMRPAELVSLVDLLPTLVDIADINQEIDLVSPVDGRSLSPLLTHRPFPHENVIYSENTSETVTAPQLMVRRDDWKLIWCSTDPLILYNLANDPDELVNLAGNPDYAGVEAALLDELHRRWDVEQLNQRVLQSQRTRFFIGKALSQGRGVDWQGKLPPSGRFGFIGNDQGYHSWSEASTLSKKE